MEQENLELNWDARQGFCQELIKRLDIFMGGNPNHLHEWFESLLDFYDTGSCMLEQKDADKIEKELQRIQNLIWQKFKLDKDRKIAYQKAYNDIRVIFRQIHRKYKEAGLYLPQREKPNPKTALLRNED